MRNGGRYSWILVRDGDGWKIRRDTADEGTVIRGSRLESKRVCGPAAVLVS